VGARAHADSATAGRSRQVMPAHRSCSTASPLSGSTTRSSSPCLTPGQRVAACPTMCEGRGKGSAGRSGAMTNADLERRTVAGTCVLAAATRSQEGCNNQQAKFSHRLIQLSSHPRVCCESEFVVSLSLGGAAP
jgi:hypothetical protein